MYSYPQTPARVQLSLWPAEPKIIDWNSSYTSDSGYFYALVGDISIECYDPPEGAVVTGSKSYIYDSNVMTNNTVETTDKDTILASFYATGADPNADPNGGDTTDISVPTGSTTISLMDAPTTSSTGPSSTGFIQGGGGSSSGLSTGAKAGVGVGVPLAVILIAVTAFFVLRRKRLRKPSFSGKGTRYFSSGHEKPELAAEYDPTVAGPVKDRAELRDEESRKKELNSGWLPPELPPKSSASAPWNHDAGGYRPPELHSTSITEVGSSTNTNTDTNTNSSTSGREHRIISRKPVSVSDPSKHSRTLSAPAAVVSSSAPKQSNTLQPQQSSSTADELAEEADVVVQELGLVNMRKKTLTTEATTKGVQPEALEGRKGAEYQKLLKRESSLRERLDEIEREREGVQ